MTKISILIKGAGEVATAIAHKLSTSGFNILITELETPLAIHRGTSFSEAVWEKEKEVEGVIAKFVDSVKNIKDVWYENKVPLMIDPTLGKALSFMKPDVLIDATMVKRNPETRLDYAPLVIGVGPGFEVGVHANLVVETNNFDQIGKVITSGTALPDTGIPLEIGGHTFKRVLRNSVGGNFEIIKDMGSLVKKEDIVAKVNGELLKAQIDGCVRAILRSGIFVKPGTKLCEIDPRSDTELYKIIRARMRTIAGGVLEAVMYWHNKRRK